MKSEYGLISCEVLMLAEVPAPVEIEPEKEFATPEIIAVKHIAHLRIDVVIILEEKLNRIIALPHLEAKAQVGSWFEYPVACYGLIQFADKTKNIIKIVLPMSKGR